MKSIVVSVILLAAGVAAYAQIPEIPTLQVCNGTSANGSAIVHLTARKDIANSGDFELSIEVKCDPAGNGFPAGAVSMRFSLSDSSIKDFRSASIDQLTTTGKHTPTMYLNGRCMANAGTIPCHYWLMIADNRQPTNTAGTPDVIGVLVVDKAGHRLTYGTGPVIKGDITVAGTGN